MDRIPDFNNLSKPQPEKAAVIKTIAFEQQLQRQRISADLYNIALQAAESPLYPNRFQLCQVYQQIVLDAQVTSGMLQRKSNILSQRFNLVNAKDEPDEVKTKLLNQKWFYEFVDLALDSIFWGFSLIQFSEVVNDNFTDIQLVPRIYVVPEYSLVRNNTATVLEGVNFTEAPWSYWCIGVGQKKNLGLLMKLAPYVIWKKNAMAAWAEFGEIFGSPLRTGYTDVRDETTRQNMVNMMKQMGAAPWAVIDTDDKIEFAQVSKTDAFQVFDKMVDRCNSEISKIILGQTGTTDEKAYSGSSNVHHEIAEVIGKQDILLMEFVINNQLLPMLIDLGFPLKGLTFKYDQSESLGIEEQAKIDASFMPYMTFSKDYLEQKYNIEIDEVTAPSTGADTATVAKKLKNLYK